MKITRCDKCGKEINLMDTYYVSINRPFAFATKKELCRKCVKKFFRPSDLIDESKDSDLEEKAEKCEKN